MRVIVAPPGPKPLGALRLEVAHEETHGAPRSALVSAGTPGGTGDVEVRPGIGLGKAREEAGGGDAARFPAPDVRHIGKVGFQLLLVGLPEGHAPGAVAGAFPGLKEGGGKVIVV